MIDNKLKVVYDSVYHNPELSASIGANVLKLKNVSNEMYDYIDSDLSATIRLAGGEDSFNQGYSSGNNKVPTDYFISQGNGQKFQEKMLGYYSALQEIAPGQFADSLKNAITELKDPEFSQSHFHEVPLMAVNTILNKYKNDVRNNELACLRHLIKSGVRK